MSEREAGRRGDRALQAVARATVLLRVVGAPVVVGFGQAMVLGIAVRLLAAFIGLDDAVGLRQRGGDIVRDRLVARGQFPIAPHLVEAARINARARCRRR